MYDAARKYLGPARLQDRALAGRQLRHLARHGRLLDHGIAARRRDEAPLGRARAYRRAALGRIGRRKQSGVARALSA